LISYFLLSNFLIFSSLFTNFGFYFIIFSCFFLLIVKKYKKKAKADGVIEQMESGFVDELSPGKYGFASV